MSEITVSGNTYEEALAEGLRQLGVPLDAVEVSVVDHADEELLPGAEPLPGTTLRLRVDNELVARQAKTHLKRILELIGIDADIEVLERRGGVVLNILAGEENALIIGRNGQNLDALQYLINRMVSGVSREMAPIAIDAEGYREKRIEKLEDIAHRTASRVLRQRRDIELEPMSAADRKVIHMALRGTRGVHTISRGEDLDRSVIVTYGSGDMSPGRDRDSGRGRRPGQGRRGTSPRAQGGSQNQSQAHPPLNEDDPDYDDNFGNR